MVKLAFNAALLAIGAAMVSAVPVERAATQPRVISNGGRLQVVGVGQHNKGFNHTATFDKPSGKLTLGSMSSNLQLTLLTHDATYTHSTGYIWEDPVACVTANKATGPTSFYLDACPGNLSPGDTRDPEELRKRQLFTFTLGGGQLNVVLGDTAQGVAVRPNVRIVGGNEVHTTPTNGEENMQLYLNPYA